MSASTVDNAVVVTITSATTATTDGIQFSAISGAELQEQILDYAHHLAASDDQPVLLELRNPATGRGDVIEMTPDGTWHPAHAAPEPGHPEAAPMEPSAPPPVEMHEHPIADDDGHTGGQIIAPAAAPDVPPVVDEQLAQPAADEAASQPGTVEAVEQDSPWRGVTPGHVSPNARPRSTPTAERRSRGLHVPPPASGRLRTVWRRHRTPLMVIGLITLVALVGIGVGAGRLIGAAGGDTTPLDPATAPAPPVATADPTSDEVECPSRTTGALTTGRDPGNQTSGPNAIKAFNYGYYKWRSGNAARAVVSSNAKVGTAITLQSYIDVLDPNMRYCLAITEKRTGPRNTTVYEVVHTIIPAAGGERQTFRQDVTTTVIGGKHWVSEIDDK